MKVICLGLSSNSFCDFKQANLFSKLKMKFEITWNPKLYYQKLKNQEEGILSWEFGNRRILRGMEAGKLYEMILDRD